MQARAASTGEALEGEAFSSKKTTELNAARRVAVTLHATGPASRAAMSRSQNARQLLFASNTPPACQQSSIPQPRQAPSPTASMARTPEQQTRALRHRQIDRCPGPASPRKAITVSRATKTWTAPCARTACACKESQQRKLPTARSRPPHVYRAALCMHCQRAVNDGRQGARRRKAKAGGCQGMRNESCATCCDMQPHCTACRFFLRLPVAVASAANHAIYTPRHRWRGFHAAPTRPRPRLLHRQRFLPRLHPSPPSPPVCFSAPS